jgi:hypothetical protein
MKFVHLIEINAADNPLIAPLTRAQVWRGLVMRAERPTLFVLALDACEITGRSENGLFRTLQFGKLIIHDEVHFVPQQHVQYHVPQQNDIPASNLTMTIEEPVTGALFVRFEYDDHQAASDDAEAEFYNNFRRDAYKESDIDTIRKIRELAMEGQLDAPLQ